MAVLKIIIDYSAFLLLSCMFAFNRFRGKNAPCGY
jgi:hypothetical protein